MKVKYLRMHRSLARFGQEYRERGGAWSRAWRLMIGTLIRGTQHPIKKYVAEDQHGNRFYELEGSSSGRGTQVDRGYDPPDGIESPNEPSVEWQSWIKRTRRFPPSDEEIRLNVEQRARISQQQQVDDARLQQQAPKIESSGTGAADMDRRHGGQRYPTYKDEEIEPAPGAQKQSSAERQSP